MKSRQRLERFGGKQFILMVYVVLRRHWPEFGSLLERIPDHRRRRTYRVAELLMAGLSMYLFKRRSRNNADLMCRGAFEENYAVVFGMRLPLMDTVDLFLRELDPAALERLKVCLVRGLVEKKVLERWKSGGRYLVCFDGSGAGSYDYEPFAGCPHKTSKTGRTSWQAYVLEAKLVCAGGLCISLASCWLDNHESLDDKQDCELKAFKRLAAQVKTLFPRLPLLLLADSLYACRTVMDICRDNGWCFVITLKDTVLKTVWEEVGLLLPLHPDQRDEKADQSPRGRHVRRIRYINGINYRQHRVGWVEYTGKPEEENQTGRFCYITNIHMDTPLAWRICEDGRQRWRIENEGFNTQKNGGYNMEHKFSRRNINARKNYYELMQIAHMVNQLTEKLAPVKEQMARAGITLAALVEDVLACMRMQVIRAGELTETLHNYRQLRY